MNNYSDKLQLDLDFMVNVVGKKAVRKLIALENGTINGFIKGHSLNQIAIAFKKEAKKRNYKYNIEDIRCLYYIHRPDEMIYITIKYKRC